MTKIRRFLMVLAVVVVSAGLGMTFFGYINGGVSTSDLPVLGQGTGFSLLDVSGQRHDSNEWLGRVVLLNFWAPWCPPCRKEIPGFVNLHHTYHAQGLMVVGVAIDQLAEVLSFVTNFKVDYLNLLGEESGAELAVRYGNRSGGLPYTVIIDRTGKVVRARLGELSAADAEQFIRPLL
ncbi:cytochrome c biogenesis protein CcmG, thiol:disulfide interchange protein DsbE [Gammaproteobacteria bacterium]